MGYILGLFLILGLVFYSAGQFGLGGDVVGNFGDSIKNSVGSVRSKIYDTVFPKSEKEILIDNLQSDYNYLDKFFNNTAPKILESKNVSDQDKTAIREASAKFNETKKSVQLIKALEGKDNKGIVETIVDKFFKDDAPLLEPTSIPPQCRLECN